jgi:hypothetical protein
MGNAVGVVATDRMDCRRVRDVENGGGAVNGKYKPKQST